MSENTPTRELAEANRDLIEALYDEYSERSLEDLVEASGTWEASPFDPQGGPQAIRKGSAVEETITTVTLMAENHGCLLKLAEELGLDVDGPADPLGLGEKIWAKDSPFAPGGQSGGGDGGRRESGSGSGSSSGSGSGKDIWGEDGPFAPGGGA